MRKVLLALGNDLLGDDAVGFCAARLLKEDLRETVEVVESAETGLALLDILEGADFALILDAMVTGTQTPGTIHEFGSADFMKPAAPSTHFAGLPEIIRLAGQMKMAFPKTVRILAMEIGVPWEFGQKLSPGVENALPAFAARAREIVTAG